MYVVQTGSGNITTIFKAPTQGDNSVKSSSANPAIVVKDDFNPQGPLNGMGIFFAPLYQSFADLFVQLCQQRSPTLTKRECDKLSQKSTGILLG